MPCWIWLSTSIVPPIRSTIFLTMARPRPLPLTLLTRVSTARENSEYISFMNSGVMPIPVSLTIDTSRTIPGFSRGSSYTSKRTMPPSGVYFTALDKRFMYIWPRRS